MSALPSLDPLGPGDVAGGPWVVARGAPRAPLLDGRESALSLALLGFYLGTERGDARGWSLVTDAWTGGQDAGFGHLLPLLAEMALRSNDASALGWVLGQARLEAPTHPAWAAWQAAAPAFERRPDVTRALRALAPLSGRDDEAGDAARLLVVYLTRAQGDHASARRVIDDVLRRAPGDQLAHRDAAQIAVAQGDLDGALVHARAAARIDPWLFVHHEAGAPVVDAQTLVVDLVTRLVAAPPPADPARRQALLREVVPELPLTPEGWTAARASARWDPEAGVLR